MFDFQEFISEAMRFTRVYSIILKVKIIILFVEETEGIIIQAMRNEDSNPEQKVISNF